MFVERVIRSTAPVLDHTGPRRNVPLTCRLFEPPIGIAPMTYALRGACSPAAHPLAAPIARIIALTTLVALGLSKDPFHEPFHDRRPVPRRPCSPCVTSLRHSHQDSRHAFDARSLMPTADLHIAARHANSA